MMMRTEEDLLHHAHSSRLTLNQVAHAPILQKVGSFGEHGSLEKFYNARFGGNCPSTIASS